MQEFPEIAARLKRAHGHLAKVIDMLDAARPLLDLAQQLHAVEKAVGNAKKQLIKDYIDHCIDESSEPVPREIKSLIEELQSVTKYL